VIGIRDWEADKTCKIESEKRQDYVGARGIVDEGKGLSKDSADGPSADRVLVVSDPSKNRGNPVTKGFRVTHYFYTLF